MPTRGLLVLGRVMGASNRSIGPVNAATTVETVHKYKRNLLYFNHLRLMDSREGFHREAEFRSSKESRQSRNSRLQLFEICCPQCHMPHFSPGPRRLPIQM